MVWTCMDIVAPSIKKIQGTLLWRFASLTLLTIIRIAWCGNGIIPDVVVGRVFVLTQRHFFNDWDPKVQICLGMIAFSSVRNTVYTFLTYIYITLQNLLEVKAPCIWRWSTQSQLLLVHGALTTHMKCDLSVKLAQEMSKKQKQMSKKHIGASIYITVSHIQKIQTYWSSIQIKYFSTRILRQKYVFKKNGPKVTCKTHQATRFGWSFANSAISNSPPVGQTWSLDMVQNAGHLDMFKWMVSFWGPFSGIEMRRFSRRV